MKIVETTMTKPKLLENSELVSGRVYRYMDPAYDGYAATSHYYMAVRGDRAINLRTGDDLNLDCSAFRWVEVPNAELHV